jgi:arylsulfatase A-like enzyme
MTRPRVRRLRARTQPALVALIAVVACGPPSFAPGTRTVVARWADLSASGNDVLPPSKALRLGTRTRESVEVMPVSQLAVSAPETASTLLFSVGARAPGPASGQIHFSIQAQLTGGWRTIFSDAVVPDEGKWHDHEIDLVAVAPGARSFRFETRSEPALEATENVQAWWGSVTWLSREAPGATPAPNVILISLDTLGAAQLSSFENAPGVSPRIDAFLDEGFSFRRAYAQYGNTLVSHASLFTGLYPVHHGFYPGGPLVAIDSLVANLARAGWLTAAFTEGAFVSASYGFGHGFDWYDDGALGLSRQIAGGASQTFTRAGDWLEGIGRDTRFFLFLHTYEVHAPYLPRDDEARAVVKRLVPNDGRVFSSETQARLALAHNSGHERMGETGFRKLHALHSAEIHWLDRILGDFLARLDALGLADDTLVVLTSDHGDQFGEADKVGHGETLHNRVHHVPLGFRWPGQIEPGRSDTPVQLIDVLPTVFDLVGRDVPAERDGRSLVPIMAGKVIEARPAFGEQITARGECLRLKLPRECRLDRYSVQTGRFKYVTSKVPAYERLYDLDVDPLETRDVLSEHPEESERHRELLRRYLADAPAARTPGAIVAPDEATRERLEALGYLD